MVARLRVIVVEVMDIVQVVTAKSRSAREASCHSSFMSL